MRPVTGWVGNLRPLHVGLLGGLLALGVVLGRLLVPADGDISRFVVAGDVFVDPDTVDPSIHVYDDSWGYDGQFFWRLAVDPAEWDLERHHHGVIFDSAHRPPRLGYPVLAWTLSGGHAPWAATTLVVVNVLAVGAIAGLGASIAQRAGRAPIAGLLVATTPGLVYAVARDLSDAVALAAVLAGIVALQRGRVGWATAAWVGAVVTREQALVVVAGYGLWRVVALVQSWRRHPAPVATPALVGAPDAARPGDPGPLDAADDPDDARDPPVRFGLADLPWLAPALVVPVLQLLVWARAGTLPFTDANEANFSYPFGELGPALWDWVRGDTPAWDDVLPFQFALAVVLVVLAFRRARELPEGDRWLPVSLALVMAVAVSFGEKVWEGPADLRQVLDVLALSWVILLVAPRRIPPWLVGAAGVVWLATAAVRSYAI